VNVAVDADATNTVINLTIFLPYEVEDGWQDYIVPECAGRQW
jgi:hypothetical protein